MKITFTTLFITFYAFLFSQQPYWNWADAVNGPTNEDELDAIASDHDANAYISGKYEDTLFINNYDDTLISNGMADIMLMKYDSTGSLQWYKSFGGPGEDNAFDAVCDDNGDLIVSGYFQQTFQVGSETLTSNGGFDVFIIKFTPNGDVVWAIQFGGAGDEGGNEVSIGPNNKIIASADSDGDFNLDGTTYANTGNRDAYLISIESNGNVEWVRAIEGSGGVRSKSVAVDTRGNIYYGGDFFGANEVVDENNVGNPLTFVANQDAYLTRWSADGALKWVKSWGGAGFEYCKGLACDSEGNVFASGPFENTVDFDGENLISDGGIDFFLWKLDSNGNNIWLNQISSPSDVLEGGELIEDGQDGVAFGMGMEDVLTIDDGTGTQQFNLPTAGKYPIFINYDGTGNVAHVLEVPTSLYGTSGEISRSGNYIFLDIVYGGGITLGSQTFMTTPVANKDGIISCIYLPGLTLGQNTDFKAVEESIYPNPFNEIVNVQSEIKGQKWVLYNSLGQEIKRFQQENKTLSLDLSELKPGVYFFKSNYNAFKIVKN